VHGDPLANAAWAIYPFLLDGYADEPSLNLTWNTAPQLANLWLGLANFTKDHWQWFNPSDAAVLDYLDNTDYFTPAGNFYAVVLVLGADPAALDRIRVGPALIPGDPPVADINAAPVYGPAPLTVDFSGAGSYDPDGGAIVLYEWDADGDGSYEGNTGDIDTYQYQYEDDGQYAATLRVTDSDGLTDTDSITVTVNSNPAWNTSTPAGLTSIEDVLWDVSGNPAVFGFDQDGNLAYARATDALGAIWDAPVVVAPAAELISSGVAAVMAGGNPAVVYEVDLTGGTGVGNHELRFRRASDALGSAWGGWGALWDVPADSALAYTTATVGGNPVVLYSAGPADNRQCSYLYADDAAGSSWEVPPVPAGDAGQQRESRVVVMDGFPAFAIMRTDGPSSQTLLRLVQATTANGSAWGAEWTAADLGTDAVVLGVALAIVEGNPALAYVQADVAKYMRASDAGGQTWDAPATVSAAGYFNTEPVLAVINGNPAAAYVAWQAGNPSELHYVAAQDTLGAAWDAPAVVDISTDLSPFLLPQIGAVSSFPAVTSRHPVDGYKLWAYY
jgi:PKD repeat protein